MVYVGKTKFQSCMRAPKLYINTHNYTYHTHASNTTVPTAYTHSMCVHIIFTTVNILILWLSTTMIVCILWLHHDNKISLLNGHLTILAVRPRGQNEHAVFSPGPFGRVAPYAFTVSLTLMWEGIAWCGHKLRPNHAYLLCLNTCLGRTLA